LRLRRRRQRYAQWGLFKDVFAGRLIFLPIFLLLLKIYSTFAARFDLRNNKINRYNHETDISTAQQEKEKQTWVPQPDGNSQWSPGIGIA